MEGDSPHARHLRKGRYSRAGHFYFLTTCVYERRPVFLDPNRAKIVLESICWLNNEMRFSVDAAVVMPDHIHVVGQLHSRTLHDVMHSLKSYTANRLARSGVTTPVWQAGYHDHGLRKDEDYRTKVRYVLENPVRAGLVKRVNNYQFLILPNWWSGEF